MGNRMGFRGGRAFAILSFVFASLPAYALQISVVRVSTPQAQLWANEGGKMTAVMNVAQGTQLQVSEVERSGWRQVVIREPGKSPKWGWVRTAQISDAGGAPAAPPAQQPSAPSPSGASRSHEQPSRSAKINQTFFAGLMGGMNLTLVPAFTYTFPFGLDLGIKLFGGERGAMYLSLQNLMTYSTLVYEVPSLSRINVTTFGIRPAALIQGRQLFGSGLYLGAGGGVILDLVTMSAYELVSDPNNGTLVFGPVSFTGTSPMFLAQLGYEFRIGKIFSVVDEAQFTGSLNRLQINSDMTQAAQSFVFETLLLASLRFYF